MDYQRAAEMARKLTQERGVLDYGADRSRLLVRVLRALAEGRPVAATSVDRIADELGWAAGRSDLAILTPDEGYQLGRQLMSRFLAHAA